MTPQYPVSDVPNADKYYCTRFEFLWYVPLKQTRCTLPQCFVSDLRRNVRYSCKFYGTRLESLWNRP